MSNLRQLLLVACVLIARAYALNQGPSSTLAQAALSTHSSSILVVHESSSYDIVYTAYLVKQYIHVISQKRNPKRVCLSRVKGSKSAMTIPKDTHILSFSLGSTASSTTSLPRLPKTAPGQQPSPKMFNLREILLVACVLVVGAYAFNKTSIPHESEFPAKANAGAL
ncbi:hypothetical protein KEM48_006767 [Puccinia striiformis f. sp. tritici PST-130]|nr:hypothetical protein KEM48_006767 [Puccinia striiformis f. sp. tritici PST-130]